MNTPESRQQRIVDAVKRKILKEPDLLAQQIGIPDGVVERSAKQERQDYWTVDPEVKNDAQKYMEQAAQVAQEGAKPGEPPEDTIQRASTIFAHRLYPARLDLIRSGPRSLSVKDQISFSDHMAELGPPTEEDWS